MARNVLMITSTLPPQQDVGGLRPAMFAKYLPSYDWRPMMLTRTYPFGDENYKPTMTGITGLPSAADTVSVEMASNGEAGSHASFFDKVVCFIKPEYGRSWELIDQMVDAFLSSPLANQIDAIYATTPDFCSIATGHILARKLNVPIIVDFRDIVEQDLHSGLRSKLLYYRHIVRRYCITRRMDRALVVSNQHQKILTRRLAIPVSIIFNGYDHEMFAKPDDVQSATFTINYVGRIIAQWLRDPTILLEALDILASDDEVTFSDFEVNFIGSEASILKPLLLQYQCSKSVKICDRVVYEEIPGIVGRSCINLVLTNRDREGILTTKLFECMAVRRPILCVPNDEGALENLITKTRSGLISDNATQVAGYIKQLYQQWKVNEGRPSTVDSINVEKYSRKYASQQLADYLSEATTVNPNNGATSNNVVSIILDAFRSTWHRYQTFALKMLIDMVCPKRMPDFGNILVIAPHPDDEIFGAAGVILSTLARKQSVHIVYLTNGEDSGSHKDEERIGRERAKMTTEVRSVLGLSSSNLHYLGFPDGGVARSTASEFSVQVDKLVALIERLKPDCVLATHDMDYWPTDHVACAEVAKAAVVQSSHKANLYLYWVWAWYNVRLSKFLFNRDRSLFAFPIEAWLEAKSELVSLYLDNVSPSGFAWSGALPVALRRSFAFDCEVLELVHPR